MDSHGVITFTTDFSARDPYAGIMKGVVLSINPSVHLIDITHDIPAHDIINAAFTLAGAYAYFPKGTIHIVVVDPGVGGERRNIAILTENYIFIGPDNGLFTFACSKEKVLEIREIKNPPFLFETPSSTFHGRDVFAPCAGHLSTGRAFSEIGPVIGNIRSIEHIKPRINGNVLRGEVLSIDSFGNLITSISREDFSSFVGNRPFEILFASERFNTIETNYSKAPAGKPIVVFGSNGSMELSINKGRASSYFMVSLGKTVMVRRL